MIAYDKHQCSIIFIALKKLIAISIVFHILYHCAIMSETTLSSHYMSLTVINDLDIFFHNDCLRLTSMHKSFSLH